MEPRLKYIHDGLMFRCGRDEEIAGKIELPGNMSVSLWPLYVYKYIIPRMKGLNEQFCYYED